MKRYAMDYYMEGTLNGPACNVTMVEDADGEWVRHEDADRLRHECENHKRVRENHVQANHAAQEECRELRAENERLKMLCHSYYQVYTHNDAENHDCAELWMEGAAMDGELRELPNSLIRRSPPNTC